MRQSALGERTRDSNEVSLAGRDEEQESAPSEPISDSHRLETSLRHPIKLLAAPRWLATSLGES